MPGLLTALVFAATLPITPARMVLPNDNVHPAGRVRDGVLHVTLVADVGTWRPNGAQGPALEVAAFGEDGDELSTPGPLLRARAGTAVVATVRNRLGAALHVHGLCTRPSACAPIVVEPGDSREVRFSLDVPGTYHYWASTGAAALAVRPRADSQLGGAIVVDPASGETNDRVLVISLLDDPPVLVEQSTEPPVFALNGASFPHTERLRYAVDERVRWRVINLSWDPHAMHLHGFHFDVEARGDGSADRALPRGRQRTVVTEHVLPGGTFALSWTPTRAGNWLFHCHMVVHMAMAPAANGHEHDATGMAGLVMGIEVAGADAAARESAATKRFSLVLREEPNRYGSRPGFRMDVEGIDAPRLDAGPVPGPVLVLERGVPVEVTVVNRLSEPSAIHWHGIELDSYYDGVPGFGGRTGALAPAIAPGASFVAKFTPPRAGTFIYHTHWHDEQQLSGGLYGALIVLEPGERYDPSTDHIIVLGLNGVIARGAREPFAFNGRAEPAPLHLRAGVPNRLRLINITPNNVSLTVALVDRFDTATWTLVAKDGAALPPAEREARPARQLVSVGETFDFEFTPAGAGGGNLWLEVARGNGEWVMQARVVAR